MNDVQAAMVPASDYLNGDDVIIGPKIITVTNVRGIELAGKKRIILNFDGDEKRPYLTSKTMLRVIANAWGNEGKRDWVGRSMTLFFDPEVVFGKVKTGGIRISHLSGISEPITLLIQVRRGVKIPWTVDPLVVDSPEHQSQDDTPAQQSSTAMTDDELNKLFVNARSIAGGGTDEYRAWFMGLDKAQKTALMDTQEPDRDDFDKVKSVHEACKGVAANAAF